MLTLFFLIIGGSMTTTQIPSSVLGMGRDLAGSVFRNVVWLGKEVSSALSSGLSQVAGTTSSVWSATFRHLATIEGKRITPQGLLTIKAIVVVELVVAAIAGVAIFYRLGVHKCIYNRIQSIFSNKQSARSEDGASAPVAATPEQRMTLRTIAITAQQYVQERKLKPISDVNSAGLRSALIQVRPELMNHTEMDDQTLNELAWLSTVANLEKMAAECSTVPFHCLRR